MAIRIIPSRDPDPVTLSIPGFPGGMSTDHPSQIRLDQLDYCENMLYNDGIPDCRPGQLQTHDSYGVGGMNGKFVFYKPDGTTIDLEAWGTNLYTVQNTITTQIYSALTNTLARDCDFNGCKYLMNGAQFVKYDGATVAPVSTGAYVPTLDMGCKPDGTGSTPKEKLNYLSNSFKRSFSADGTTAYQMPFIGLTSIDEVRINGILKTAGADYTVDLINGKVNFVSGPTAGTNNVVIQATKNGLMDASKIINCKYLYAYGARLWATGNPAAPATVYNTGLTGDYTKDGSYWPENGWTIVGNDDANTGFAQHLNELILFKERSIEAGTLGSDGVMSWNKNVSANIGCDMPDTIQQFNDLVAFCNTKQGPMVLVATVVAGQRNIKQIGHNINGSNYKPGLLNEQVSDLKLASSVDDGRRYWVCVGSKAWVWDYSINPSVSDQEKLSWWFLTNINARCWSTKDRDVFFGDRNNGIVQRLTPGIYNDNGAAINKVLRTAELSPEKYKQWFKNVPRLWLTLRKGVASLVNLKLISSSKEATVAIPALMTSGGIDPDTFDPDIGANPDITYTDKTLLQKTSVKNTTGLQIEFSNAEVNQTLPIVSMKAEFELTKEI